MILLFDWTTGGHHTLYLARTAAALARSTDVVVAAPESARSDVEDAQTKFISLGHARPSEDLRRPMRPQFDRLAARELDLLDATIRQARPDAVVHMYADPILRTIVRRPRFRIPIHLLLFFPLAHYGPVFGDRLTLAEQRRARLREFAVAAWRLRPDAGTVLSLDPYAIARWRRRPGAGAMWFSEPPPAKPAGLPGRREGVTLFGALSRHKGVTRFADAVAADAHGLRVCLAGTVAPEIRSELEAAIDAMRKAGADVEVRLWRHDEQESLALLRRSGCVVLPYPRHLGMSRVLLESVAMGSPVVASAFGLVGHLAKVAQLGEVVDSQRALALNAAMRRVLDGGSERLATPMAAFARRFDADGFEGRLAAAVGSR
jgi:glycosyltransferase involved in cell wall biosynthesis